MVAWASTFSMRVRSASGTPGGKAGAASPPAFATGQSSTLTLRRTATASARATSGLLLVYTENAEAAPRRLRIAAGPCEHDLEAGRLGPLLHDDVGEVRQHRIAVRTDHHPYPVAHVETLGHVLVPDVAAALLKRHQRNGHL